MEGSGMERLFEVVYARNTVPHIMSGKVVSRALRAHLLVESALTCVLLDECTSRKDSQDTLRLAFSKFQQGELSIDEVHGYVNVTKLQNKFQAGKLELSKKLGTTKLQIQYLDYNVSLKICTNAKRIGHLTMPLECTRKMLNLFAGTDHLNYVKSARLCLQIVLNLHLDLP